MRRHDSGEEGGVEEGPQEEWMIFVWVWQADGQRMSGGQKARCLCVVLPYHRHPSRPASPRLPCHKLAADNVLLPPTSLVFAVDEQLQPGA